MHEFFKNLEFKTKISLQIYFLIIILKKFLLSLPAGFDQIKQQKKKRITNHRDTELNILI